MTKSQLEHEPTLESGEKMLTDTASSQKSPGALRFPLQVDEMAGRSADQAVAYLSQFFAKQGWIPAEKVKQAKVAQN